MFEDNLFHDRQAESRTRHRACGFRTEEPLEHESPFLGRDTGPLIRHDNLGVALQALGRDAEAEAAFERALALDPSFAPALAHLALREKKKRRYDKAFALFEKALAAKPGFVEALNNWGNALREAGQPERAVEKFNEALRFAPRLAELHNNLGAALKEALTTPGPMLIHVSIDRHEQVLPMVAPGGANKNMIGD